MAILGSIPRLRLQNRERARFSEPLRINEKGSLEERYWRRVRQLPFPLSAQDVKRSKGQSEVDMLQVGSQMIEENMLFDSPEHRAKSRLMMRERLINVLNMDPERRNSEITQKARIAARKHAVYAIDRLIDAESEEVLAKVRKHGGVIDVDDVIIGAGVAGVSAALVAAGNDRNAIILDAGYPGGNFNDFGNGDSFDLNSPDENAIDNRRYPGFGWIPGETGRPNDIGGGDYKGGKYRGLIQPSDIRFDSHIPESQRQKFTPTSWDQSSAIKADSLAVPVLRVRATKVEVASDSESTRLYKVTAVPVNGTDRRELTIYTDSVPAATGFGKEKSGLNEDDTTTKRILDEERAKYQARKSFWDKREKRVSVGKSVPEDRSHYDPKREPLVMSFKEFKLYYARLTDMQRRELIQRVGLYGAAIIGMNGDSGKVAWGTFLNDLKTAFGSGIFIRPDRFIEAEGIDRRSAATAARRRSRRGMGALLRRNQDDGILNPNSRGIIFGYNAEFSHRDNVPSFERYHDELAPFAPNFPGQDAALMPLSNTHARTIERTSNNRIKIHSQARLIVGNVPFDYQAQDREFALVITATGFENTIERDLFPGFKFDRVPSPVDPQIYNDVGKQAYTLEVSGKYGLTRHYHAVGILGVADGRRLTPSEESLLSEEARRRRASSMAFRVPRVVRGMEDLIDFSRRQKMLLGEAIDRRFEFGIARSTGGRGSIDFDSFLDLKRRQI